MKKKDLLIPLAMLALGAGIGFWTRGREQPMHQEHDDAVAAGAMASTTTQARVGNKAMQEKGAPEAGEAENLEQRRLQKAQQQIDYAFELDERCKGVSSAQMAEHTELWRRAALTGHVPSMVYYARGDGFRMRETLDTLEQLAQYKREAERMLRAASAAGSVQAAQQLTSAYISQRGPWSSLVQQAIAPNRLEALTMMELAKLRDYAPHSGPQESERWNRNSSFVDGAGVRFTTDEWAEAKERAAKLHKTWSPADDSSGQRRSLWERAEYARASCNQDRFTTPPQ
jgi:hypothetical protein